MMLPGTLAIKELRHDWQAAFCFVAAILGILAPLLVILALKNGVISTMVDRLVDDPSNRELIAVGAARHEADFFGRMGARGDVEFIVPATRSINTVLNGLRNRDARELVRNVVMIPSGADDPLSPDATVSEGQVLLSASLAQTLNADVGSSLEMRVNRRIDDRPETGVTDVTVGGIVPSVNYGRDAIFVAIEDLVAVERFRDDGSVTVDNWADATAMPDTFASFRIYARTLDDIAGLEQALAEEGVNSRPRAQNVDILISVQRGLNLLFMLIAGLALVGFWAAMSANLRGAVERQRISLSLLSLLGLSEGARRIIPLVQAVVLITIGVILSLVLVTPLIMAVNAAFTPNGFEKIAFLEGGQVAWTLVIGWVAAVLSSVWAMSAIGEIEANEVLRAG